LDPLLVIATPLRHEEAQNACCVEGVQRSIVDRSRLGIAVVALLGSGDCIEWMDGCAQWFPF
jgi:hypothetical protein